MPYFSDDIIEEVRSRNDIPIPGNPPRFAIVVSSFILHIFDITNCSAAMLLPQFFKYH